MELHPSSNKEIFDDRSEVKATNTTKSTLVIVTLLKKVLFPHNSYAAELTKARRILWIQKN